MTQAEREKIKKAIRLFSSDGDNWEGGMDILQKLVGQQTLTERLGATRTMDVMEAVRELSK